MSSVVWFYSVKGNVSTPHTWEELCIAVKEQKLGPEDLVWTKAFGREWRKASTLEGLFCTNDASAEGVEKKIEEDSSSIIQEEEGGFASQKSEEFEKEFAEQDKFEQQTDNNASNQSFYTPRGVAVWLGLKRAYYGMVNILFTSPFNIMRWLPIAVALFLATQMSSNFMLNAMSALFAEDGQIVSKLHENSKELGIPDDFYSSGVFSSEWKNNYEHLNTFILEVQEKNLSHEEMSKQLIGIYSKLIIGVGETTNYIWNWIISFSGATTFLMMFLTVFAMKMGLFWFGARGKFIAMARCYNPTEPFGVTWRSVASASNRFFRMLLVVELLTSIVYLIASFMFIKYVANAYVSEQLTVEGFCSKMLMLMMLYLLLMFVKYYLHNFVALPVLLEKQRLTPKYIFKGFGFWILRFGVIYLILFMSLQYLVGVVGALVGANLIKMIFAMPITGQLLALPIFVVNLLWTMDISVQMRPELAKLRPPVDPWQVNR